MSNWTIEFHQFSIPFASHHYWVMRDNFGNTVREFHGFATTQEGNATPFGSPFDPTDRINLYDIGQADLSSQTTSEVLGGQFFSESNPEPFDVAFSGTEAEVRAMWADGALIVPDVNAQAIDYILFGIFSTGQNSNSAAFTFGRAMGLEAEHLLDPRSGVPTNRPGWGRDLRIPARAAVNDELARLSSALATMDESSPEFAATLEEILELTEKKNALSANAPEAEECFAAGTRIAMADGSHKPIERVRVGDEVLAYDTGDASGAGALTTRRVTHTFITPDRMILDFHGLRVTPGHVFLCGEGPWAGKHRMLIDILREDGSIVGADGVSRRAATNCPVDSEGDRFVELAYITRADESEHKTARIRAGTLLIEQMGEARSVLQCLEAEGYQLLEDGLVLKPGEAPGPLKFFGTPPKPEDYVLKRSGLTLAEIAGNTGYEPRPANPWGSALASGWTPDDSRSGEAERELFLAGTPTRNTAGETLH